MAATALSGEVHAELDYRNNASLKATEVLV